MATVKSLEERIDDMADDLSAVKAQLGTLAVGQAAIQAQLASVVNGIGSLTAQLAVVTARLDSAVGDLNKTNARIDTVTTRIDGLATELSAFRAKTETSFSTARWAVTFAAGVFITVLGSAFLIAREAGRLDSRVEQHQKSLDEVRKDMSEIRSKLK
jgi:peptidoglycan hydrolase CwlO-like protein